MSSPTRPASTTAIVLSDTGFVARLNEFGKNFLPLCHSGESRNPVLDPDFRRGDK